MHILKVVCYPGYIEPAHKTPSRKMRYYSKRKATLVDALRELTNYLQQRLLFWRISAAGQKLRERYFCDCAARRKVRFVQDENSLSLATEPPTVAVLALINLALLSSRHNHRTVSKVVGSYRVHGAGTCAGCLGGNIIFL
jgi:hypothetical protein